MRLAPADARHEPIAGIWARVCESCYSTRDGYFDSNGIYSFEAAAILSFYITVLLWVVTLGVSRKRTLTFLKLRKARVDLTHLEVNRLEKRLEKVFFDFKHFQILVFLTKN